MTGEYTHKVILFTEEVFDGDAFVIMRSQQYSNAVPLTEIEYYHDAGHLSSVGDVPKKDFTDKFRSIFVAKGVWTFHLNKSTEIGYNNPTKASEFTMGDEELHNNYGSLNFSPDCFERVEPRLDVPPAVSKQRPDSKKRNGSKYTITFFPILHSFAISPAPQIVVDDLGFRWIFQDDDELTICWRNDNSVTDTYLEFGRHLEDKDGNPLLDDHGNQLKADRAAPIWILDSGGKFKPPVFAHPIKWGETVQFKKGDHKISGRWYFNFCCKVNGEPYCVDPESEMGSGAS